MSIRIANRTFAGPYTSTESLRHQSGVYVVLCKRQGGNHVTDVGEATDVRERVESHDRESCWRRHCPAPGRLTFAALYTPSRTQAQRRALEREVRAFYRDIPCGER